LARLQDELVRSQVRDSIGPFSPLWRRRFNELNRKPGTIRTVTDLESIPAMGERDVSPNGDPAGMAALVLQAGEAGFALHAPGPDLRHAMRLRASRSDEYRRIVDADTRATSYVFSGAGFTYPIASTRSDLDVVTRAGKRMWELLGLTANDVLVSAVEPAATTEHVGLQYAALGAGAPALFPGGSAEDLAAALRLAPPTVLALPSSRAPQLLDGLGELGSVRTALLVGAPSDAERLAAAHALHRAGADNDVAILAVHAPAGARVLWGECRASGGAAGLHTYPDLEVVQVVDPDTGEPTLGPGELVLTQLGMRGSALLRWRTADVVAGIATGQCPSCRRMVPRVEGLRRGALVAGIGGHPVDLRTIASALAGRGDLVDWRIVVGHRRRDGAPRVTVHLVSDHGTDDSAAVIGAATDIRAVAGALPTQIIAGDERDLAEVYGERLSNRMLIDS
jgi:phenylacetate-coenzyme A ligase PaaK-like adenylate-forming protein